MSNDLKQGFHFSSFVLLKIMDIFGPLNPEILFGTGISPQLRPFKYDLTFHNKFKFYLQLTNLPI